MPVPIEVEICLGVVGSLGLVATALIAFEKLVQRHIIDYTDNLQAEKRNEELKSILFNASLKGQGRFN